MKPPMNEQMLQTLAAKSAFESEARSWVLGMSSERLQQKLLNGLCRQFVRGFMMAIAMQRAGVDLSSIVSKDFQWTEARMQELEVLTAETSGEHSEAE